MSEKTYISKIKLPNNETTYYIKDEEAQTSISNILQNISSGVHFCGRSLQLLSDGGIENPWNASGNLPNGTTYPNAGDIFLQYGNSTTQEFIWVEGSWELLGDENAYLYKIRLMLLFSQKVQ